MAKPSLLATAILVAITGMTAPQQDLPQPQKPTENHALLQRFVGEWECENSAFMAPGAPAVQFKSGMSNHAIGGLWAVIVVKADGIAPPYHAQGTFGYDSKKKKYIGTWADSMSSFMWQYEGAVEGNKLIFHSKGPAPWDPRKTVRVRDTWEFKGDDVIELTGEMEARDGKLMKMLTATCRRK